MVGFSVQMNAFLALYTKLPQPTTFNGIELQQLKKKTKEKTAQH